jgi:hypothetical protein
MYASNKMDAIVVETPAPAPDVAQRSSSSLLYLLGALLIAVLGANILVILAHTTEFAKTAMGQAIRRIAGDFTSAFDWTAAPVAAPIDRAPVAQRVEPQADETQPRALPTTGTAGWCYVGQQRGLRSCIKVGDNDYCESGSVFPTEAVCVNPSLRP